MRAVLMVVAYVFRDQPLQMPFIQDDDMVEQFSSATSYPAFRNPVLPWAAKCGADRLGSDCPCGGEHFVAKLRIAIEQQERASGGVKKSMAAIASR